MDIFIVNENLKNGLDDWPKSYTAIEKEFRDEYDTMSTFTIKPTIRNEIVNAAKNQFDAFGSFATNTNIPHISNTLAGLDLSYSDLKIFRNFSTASIVKYDDNEMQLYLDNFSNRSQFMLDVIDPINKQKIRDIKFITLNPEGGQDIQFDESVITGQMSFTFADWPILGQNRENTIRAGDSRVHESRGDFYLDTMTPERVEWCVELFKWFDTLVVDGPNTNNVTGTGIPDLPYADFLNTERSVGRAQAALNIFSSYFTPWPLNGIMKWYGILPYRQGGTVDGPEHSFLSARNAPCYYYRQGGEKFNQEDIISTFEMLNGSNNAITYSPESNVPSNRETYLKINNDYNNYVSHYEKAINLNEIRSQIKVIRPDLISAFAQEFKKKLNQGLTRTSGTTITGTGISAAGTTGGITSGTQGAGGASVGSGISGTGGYGGGGGSTGGGGGNY